MNLSADLRSFYKSCSKKFGLSMWVHALIHWYEYTSGYDTVSFSNLGTTILVQWLSQITYYISPIEVDVQWVYPGSMFDSNITEYDLMWLAGLKEKPEIISDKGFFKQFRSEKWSSFQNLKKLLILTTPISTNIERFTGSVSDWSILNNNWPIQKLNLLTLIWGGGYATVK